MRIPSPLRSYTDQQKVVVVDGAASIGEVLDELERRFPGIRFRVIDEQGRVREHMRLYVNQDAVDDLTTPLTTSDEVTIMQALSGG